MKNNKNLNEFILFNPKESIKKGSVAKKIPMEKLQPYQRRVGGFEIAKFSGGSKFRNGDTLLARITPCLENGKTAQINCLDENKVGFGSTEFIVLRAIENISDPDFVYYLSISPKFREIAIKSMVGSSGRQRVQQDVLENLEIFLPDLNEQRKIASVLSSLDDKIELNNKINQNLEAQAQAIFKSWFVENSNNWELCKIGDIVTKTISGDWGKDVKTERFSEKVLCVRGADIPTIKEYNTGKMPTRYISQKNYNEKKLTSNNLVVEISGGSPTQSTGRVALITEFSLEHYGQDLICTNFCRAIQPKQGYEYFLFYYWQYLYNKNVFFTYENGTTGIKNLDLSAIFENELIKIPPNNILEKFNLILKSIFYKKALNGMETQRLAQLRDTLLPKLMSGEIDVSNLAV